MNTFVTTSRARLLRRVGTGGLRLKVVRNSAFERASLASPRRRGTFFSSRSLVIFTAALSSARRAFTPALPFAIIRSFGCSARRFGPRRDWVARVRRFVMKSLPQVAQGSTLGSIRLGGPMEPGLCDQLQYAGARHRVTHR